MTSKLEVFHNWRGERRRSAHTCLLSYHCYWLALQFYAYCPGSAAVKHSLVYSSLRIYLSSNPVLRFKVKAYPHHYSLQYFEKYLPLLYFGIIIIFPAQKCSPFNRNYWFPLLQNTQETGDSVAHKLLNYHKQEVKMLVYLISRKHVPTKRGNMYFGTWINVEGVLTLIPLTSRTACRATLSRAAGVICRWAK